MLRYGELLLFLAPFLLFAGWRIVASGNRPSARAVTVSLVALAVVLGGLLWFQRQGALPPDTTYVPAALQGGRVLPAHGARP